MRIDNVVVVVDDDSDVDDDDDDDSADCRAMARDVMCTGGGPPVGAAKFRQAQASATMAKGPTRI